MLLGSSTGLPNSIMPHLFSIPYTGSQLKKKDWFQTRFTLLKISEWFCPAYLSDLLHLYTPSRRLRSSADTRVFRIPSFCTKSSSQHSFSYQAPTTWNKLPAFICYACSVSSFKSCLKTFLFLKLFLQFPCPEVLVWVKVCVCVRVCVCMCVCVCVSECGCICLLFVYFNFLCQNIYVCYIFNR